MIYRSVAGFHLCLHIQGCFATCGTITETPSLVVCLSSGRADPTHLDTVAQTVCCQKVHFPLFNWLITGFYMTTRLGAVAFTVLWCKWSNMMCTPRTVMQGWGCNTSARASRWPSMVPHRGARGCAISVYPTPWPPTLSGVLPLWCTFQVASLLVVTEEAAIVDVPGRNSLCTSQRRGKRWDHSPGQGFSQPWYKGSYSIHNPALLAKRNVLLRGQMVAYYHG